MYTCAEDLWIRAPHLEDAGAKTKWRFLHLDEMPSDGGPDATIVNDVFRQATEAEFYRDKDLTRLFQTRKLTPENVEAFRAYEEHSTTSQTLGLFGLVCKKTYPFDEDEWTWFAERYPDIYRRHADHCRAEYLTMLKTGRTTIRAAWGAWMTHWGLIDAPRLSSSLKRAFCQFIQNRSEAYAFLPIILGITPPQEFVGYFACRSRNCRPTTSIYIYCPKLWEELWSSIHTQCPGGCLVFGDSPVNIQLRATPDKLRGVSIASIARLSYDHLKRVFNLRQLVEQSCLDDWTFCHPLEWWTHRCPTVWAARELCRIQFWEDTRYTEFTSQGYLVWCIGGNDPDEFPWDDDPDDAAMEWKYTPMPRELEHELYPYVKEFCPDMLGTFRNPLYQDPVEGPSVTLFRLVEHDFEHNSEHDFADVVVESPEELSRACARMFEFDDICVAFFHPKCRPAVPEGARIHRSIFTDVMLLT